MKTSFISVILLNKNGQEYLENCLKSIILTNYPNFEIVFVDNNSKDQSVRIAKRCLVNFKNKKIIENKKELGWSGGNNLGIKYAKGEILTFLSSDTEVEKNWLKELAKVLLSSPSVGIAQSQTFSLKNKKEIDSGKNFIDPFGFAYSALPSSYPEEVFFAEGVSMAVKKEVFDKIGLFDRDFFIMYDDIDFCWRAQLFGFRVMIAPKSIVYHKRGGTVGGTIIKTNPFMVFLNTKNHLTSLFKNYSLSSLIFYFPILLIFQLLKSFLFLLIYKSPKAFFAILKGLLSFFFNLKVVSKKREVIQKRRKIHDSELKKKMVRFSPALLYKIFRTRKPLLATHLPLHAKDV